MASSSKVPPNLKQREYVKLKGSVKKGKQEPRDHHQTQHSPNSLALFATDSLELNLAYTAINICTHKHTHSYTPNIKDLRWSFSVMRDEQSVGMYSSSSLVLDYFIVALTRSSISLFYKYTINKEKNLCLVELLLDLYGNKSVEFYLVYIWYRMMKCREDNWLRTGGTGNVYKI